LEQPEEGISALFALIGQPARIRILAVISTQKACVCHMEAVLEMRQASISQHLMILRKTGLVRAEREGRNIYYRLARPAVLEILRQAGEIAGSGVEMFEQLARRPVGGCPCPQCNPVSDPAISCQKLHPTSAARKSKSTFKGIKNGK
jgi:ArsR family transcriptional regulator